MFKDVFIKIVVFEYQLYFMYCNFFVYFLYDIKVLFFIFWIFFVYLYLYDVILYFIYILFQYIGCDWGIDFLVKEDRCGVCYGDGLICEIIKD